MQGKIQIFVLAVLCFTPTLVNVPQAILYGLISLIGLIVLVQKIVHKKLSKSDYVLFSFLLLSFIIFFAGDGLRESTTGKSKNDLVPYTLFIVTTIFFARSLHEDVLKFVFYFILFEIIIGVLEYIFGVPYLIKPLSESQTEFGSTDILYYNKVYGISAVTSVFSQKVLIGLILLFYLNIVKYRKIYLGLLLIGLLITFNRTAIVTSLFFLALLFRKSFKKLGIKYKAILIICLLSFLFLTYLNIEIILFQFFRGSGDIDYSGRDYVFVSFIDFISNNFFFGNFAQKVWIELGGRTYHAHNSYLETLASLGFILTLIFVFYLFKIITRKKMIFLLPILLYSTFQFGIFWGVSLLDIVFFFLIFSNTKSAKET
ncbi:hypothetical protein [Croceiramulus getboli]|nr:O-antigen ligase family protein [Flavobacteriaceae bacterium YJPT1-3]